MEDGGGVLQVNRAVWLNSMGGLKADGARGLVHHCECPRKLKTTSFHSTYIFGSQVHSNGEKSLLILLPQTPERDEEVEI